MPLPAICLTYEVLRNHHRGFSHVGQPLAQEPGRQNHHYRLSCNYYAPASGVSAPGTRGGRYLTQRSFHKYYLPRF